MRSMLVLLAVALGAERATACTLAAPELHVLDPREQEQDHTPPAALGAVTVTVTRGDLVGSTCDGIGAIALRFQPPVDDRTPSAQMGYEIAIAAGSAPVFLSSGAVRARDGVLYLNWGDGATDEQEPLDFTIYVTPIDLGGQRGPSTLVAVQDPGREPSR